MSFPAQSADCHHNSNTHSNFCWDENCSLVLPEQKRTIVVMHHVISKNLQSDFAAMH